MVYLSKIVIFHGYVSHNQMVSISSSYPAIVFGCTFGYCHMPQFVFVVCIDMTDISIISP